MEPTTLMHIGRTIITSLSWMMRDMNKGESEMAEDEGWSYTVTARVRSCATKCATKGESRRT